jgi:hypothetical protein
MFGRRNKTPEPAAPRHWCSPQPLPDDAPEWSRRDQEPPMSVTRVRSNDDCGVAMIRGAECNYEGPGHSHWAYVESHGQHREPTPDSTRDDRESSWECWLEMDFTGSHHMIDDTANDDR